MNYVQLNSNLAYNLKEYLGFNEQLSKTDRELTQSLINTIQHSVNHRSIPELVGNYLSMIRNCEIQEIITDYQIELDKLQSEKERRKERIINNLTQNDLPEDLKEVSNVIGIENVKKMISKLANYPIHIPSAFSISKSQEPAY